MIYKVVQHFASSCALNNNIIFQQYYELDENNHWVQGNKGNVYGAHSLKLNKNEMDVEYGINFKKIHILDNSMDEEQIKQYLRLQENF